MKRVFVFEYLTGGGEVGSDAERDELMPMGRLMRDALVADLLTVPGVQVSAALCRHAPEVPAGARGVAARTGEATLDFMARESAAHDLACVVAPETGGLLLKYSRCVSPARWVGCSPQAIALASSKQATLRQLEAAGVCTPLAITEARRWVVKPDDGAGAIDTRVHHRHEAALQDLQARTRRGEPATMEPWVEGDALSLSLLCRGAGEAEVLSVNSQQVAVDAQGAVRFLGVQVNALPAAQALTQVAEAVARALPGLKGFVGIDLVWHAQHGPVVIEVNPRITCAYAGLSAALERPLAAELLALFEREPAHA